ncbi:GntR family transcriptional regulator [Nocardia sp. NPDC023852]|uniref:GntR family transcriptional regulator n=1 Tax=Nocardia sp. NPDC023852 TaxID=3154697 RepID=UPI0033D27DCC
MSASLPKVPRRGLARETADLIRSAIFAGGFAPGAPLREVELAAALGVSRGSVREGLALLDNEGLIHRGWHRGTSVIEITAHDVEDVYALRAALDRLAAVTARRTATADQLTELDELVDRMAEESAADAPDARLLALDITFHDHIYTAAGNQRLSRAWEAVRSQVHLFQLRRIAIGGNHYRDQLVAEHRELAALIRSGNLQTLARRAEEHVDAARRSLLADLQG